MSVVNVEWNQLLVFDEKGTPEYPASNASEQGEEPTDSTHVWSWAQNLSQVKSGPAYPQDFISTWTIEI